MYFPKLFYNTFNNAFEGFTSPSGETVDTIRPLFEKIEGIHSPEFNKCRIFFSDYLDTETDDSDETDENLIKWATAIEVEQAFLQITDESDYLFNASMATVDSVVTERMKDLGILLPKLLTAKYRLTQNGSILD